MHLVDRFPFYPQLDGAIRGRIDHSDVTAKVDDVSVDSTWSIYAPDRSLPGIEVAEQDLCAFLSAEFGIDVEASEQESGKHRICLSVVGASWSGGETEGSFRIRVNQTSVLVEAATGIGVLHGVFHLEDLMRERGAPIVRPGVVEREPIFHRRIHRSTLSPFHVEEAAGYTGAPYERRTFFGKPIIYEAYGEEDAGLRGYYADHVLLGLARHGFNGIWIRGSLRKLTKTKLFPSEDGYPDRALPAIQDLCRRAANYGIHVYLYFNEPMGVPDADPFFETHPNARGSKVRHYQEVRCLCTSDPDVLDYLEEGMAYLCSHVPELAGSILISASEYPSHCWCHVRPGAVDGLEGYIREGLLCERCAGRDPRDIVVEVIGALHKGMKKVKPDGELIAWNWSWNLYEPDPQPELLSRLPEDVIVMGDFERGMPTRALDMEYRNEEYSLKLIGPSKRFEGVLDRQRQNGMPTYAKLQMGTTHENGTVPYLPVLQSIGMKHRVLSELGVAGIMTCWNFGNMVCVATEAANAFSWVPQDESVDDVLKRVAARHVGNEIAPVLVGAWQMMFDGLVEAFPGTNPLTYYSPMTRGPAFPWTFDRVNEIFPPSWLTVPDARADDMKNWLSVFGPDGVKRCMARLDECWSEAISRMEEALVRARGSGKIALELEIGVARMCVIQFRSTGGIIEFLTARDGYLDGTEETIKMECLDRLEAAVREERENATDALPLVDADPRLGFHAEGHTYLFNRELIEEKIGQLDEMLDVRIPQARNI
jgi:hypothetical protein